MWQDIEEALYEAWGRIEAARRGEAEPLEKDLELVQAMCWICLN